MSKQSTMPALLIGHGSPMNTLQKNEFTTASAALGRTLPQPRAVLAISAHWYINATAVTAMPRPRTIHDFHGFPPELSQFDYPAPGLPELAEEIAELVKPTGVALDHDQWGLEHGTWSVLAHLYPEADVPVVQLSIDATRPMAYHVQLGARLAALRDRGVLVLSSGNVVHNLHRVQWNAPNGAFDWNLRFDDAVAQQMDDDPSAILRTTEHPDYLAAVPTPDHFIPLLYTAGIAAHEGHARRLVRGYALGSLSMTCYGVGVGERWPEAVEAAATD